MGKIIGFAGRCRSGKSELAKICSAHGYEIMSFAIPLKQLCSHIIGTTVEELNVLKNNNTDIGLTIDRDMCMELSRKTDIPEVTVLNVSLDKKIQNVRELLQFIGTDLIRKYNADWHVNRIRDMIDPEKNYVFDDVRFKNEKNMIESLGGDCWFVIRPNIDQVSNHESETSLKWMDCFNKIIINDKTLDYLRFKWENFMDDYQDSVTLRDSEFNRVLEMYNQDRIEKVSALDMLFISEDIFTYSPKEIRKDDVSGFKLTPGNGLQVAYKDGTMEIIYNMLVIEDLKILM